MRFGMACLLVSAALLVSGCGGSSSGTSTPPPPPTAPTVTSIAPASGATGVAVNSALTATFSMSMNSATITSSTFTLTGPGSATVSGTVTYAAGGSVATFTPSANLAFGTAYTATITTGAADSSGTALSANYTWTFTTATAPAPPTVLSVTPLNLAADVAVNTALTATFSQAMNSATITPLTFTLTAPGGATVSGSVTYTATGSVATFTPSANLAYNTLYTATITTGAADSAGTALTANYAWAFATAAAPLPPTVASSQPANAAMAVPITSAVTATFNQAMTASTITSATFTLTGPGTTSVAGSVAYTASGSVATFTPAANLAYNTLYTATITTGATNSSGTPLTANYSWTFTTAAATLPTVAATAPATGASNVSLGQALTATFSQAMNSSTIDSSTFTLAGPGSTAVSGTVTYSAVNSIATFTPASALAYDTTYTATITTGVQNSAGAALAANYLWSFTTIANPNLATVDFADTLQTIRGFGGSTAWLGKMPQAVATALFSPTNGLGLSILRVRIDPEGSPTGGGTFGYPYETGEWDYEAANGGLAVAANPNAVVFATPWTPPASMKTSSTAQPYYSGSCSPAADYCGGYLNPSNYAAYASYLEDFVTFFNSRNNFDLYALSMQNEPEENVDYESCLWTPQQMDAWIDSLVTSGPNPLTAKLIMPEADSFQPAQALTALQDSTAEGLISIIGGHIYGVTPAPYSVPAGDTPKEVWMTEFGPLSSAQLTWTQALTYAQSIHQSMVNAQYNAYVWWGLFGESAGSCATAAGTCGLVDNSGNPSVVGYVMGQYSKFIQPGYTNEGVSTSTNEDPNVLISAYTGTESGTQHFVIVAINMDTTAVNQSFTLQNGAVTSMTPYQTTSTASSGTGLVPQSAITVTSNAFTYTLPAQSITTFVQ
jgi:O-glycosyl hydrolase